ncbi:MAG: nucleotidyl transferase AbiEii/AbiGii toxin family protein [Candidatus Omnitrophota bacterium]|nr:nucleotidyl transferase AbiEii/AbiGii toxin family protein [Candidatus Omnitrophota bacterium]
MITQDTVKKLAVQYRTSEFPNIVREYFQHLFLSQLYRLEKSDNLLFKGGTALRIIYGSPRFSEDLDFSIFRVEQYVQKEFIEDLFASVLAEIEKTGIKVELGPKPGATAEGYYGDATFHINNYDYQPISVSINISARNGRDVKGEVDSVANDFVSTYNIFHLSQELLVDEKVFDALLRRGKARDFYDLYFIMRKGLLSAEQKAQLNGKKDEIIKSSEKVDFYAELSVFLPQDQQAIIRDFKNNLVNELNRQLSGV